MSPALNLRQCAGGWGTVRFPGAQREEVLAMFSIDEESAGAGRPC